MRAFFNKITVFTLGVLLGTIDLAAYYSIFHFVLKYEQSASVLLSLVTLHLFSSGNTFLKIYNDFIERNKIIKQLTSTNTDPFDSDSNSKVSH